ncbi:MarR family transcriptional regulator [uncultured Erythrobacter sp.]|uniref:MarR family winged helix-turn-helix transcriptional regulator n=1 Tax=uncultured Erythrobacter sp. TaxID=263913 RepID=UPI00262149E1|nr:MarR family transcriptional regulator [uncultured Erythrobacter sp.]
MAHTFRAYHSLHQAHSAVFRAADKALKKQEGIQTAHQFILFVLYVEDGLPSALVASRAGMSKSRLTGLTNTLEDKGLIRKQRGEKDARQQVLYIAPEGRALIERTKDWVSEMNADLLADFDERERMAIEKFLRRAASSR